MKNHISVHELVDLIDTESNIQLIDVRSPGEYNAGHVPRAMNIPLEEADRRIDDLGSGPVALLCHSGNRASMACDLLQQHHPNLVVVEGGTQAWIQAGFPVTHPSGSRWSLERQVRLIAGAMVVVASLLATTVSTGWAYMALFVGSGMMFAGITNVCGMASVLKLLPWNQPVQCPVENLSEVKA